MRSVVVLLAVYCSSMYAADESSASAWCSSMTRLTALEVGQQKHNEFILSKKAEFLNLLKSSPSTVPKAVRGHISWLLYKRGDLLYGESAVVLRVAAETVEEYSLAQYDDVLTSYIALFPRQIAESEIRRIASEANWQPSAASWSRALWQADLSRDNQSGHHRSIRSPMALRRVIDTGGDF